MNELDVLRNHFLGLHDDFFTNFRKVNNYPPYNIRGNSEKGYIEMALAGFTEKDLKVEVKDKTLHVYGCKEEKKSGDFYHKGIADRTFRKIFRLHEHIKVNEAALKDGLLKISYHRDVPESEKPKQIKIKSN